MCDEELLLVSDIALRALASRRLIRAINLFRRPEKRTADDGFPRGSRPVAVEDPWWWPWLSSACPLLTFCFYVCTEFHVPRVAAEHFVLFTVQNGENRELLERGITAIGCPHLS